MVELRNEWSRLQLELAQRVVQCDDTTWGKTDKLEGLGRVGGLDISFFSDTREDRQPQDNQLRVFLRLSRTERDLVHSGTLGIKLRKHRQELKLLYHDVQEVDLSVPYMSGFLGFREAPVYADMLQRANRKGFGPQVVLVDGNGVLHHRGLGSASHLGVVLDCPSIGVSKTLLHVDGLQEATVRRRFLDHDRARSRASFSASSPAIGPADAATRAGVPAAEASATADAMTQRPSQGHVLRSGWTPAIGLSASSADGPTGTKSGSYLAALLKPPSPPAGFVATAIDSGGGCITPRAPGPWSGEVQGSQPLAAGWPGGDIRELEGGVCTMDLVGTSGTVYGRALRGHAKSKRPVYVSVGHRVSLETAVRVVLACSTFRIPEPIRMADLLGRDMVRQKQAKELKDAGEGLLT